MLPIHGGVILSGQIFTFIMQYLHLYCANPNFIVQILTFIESIVTFIMHFHLYCAIFTFIVQISTFLCNTFQPAADFWLYHTDWYRERAARAVCAARAARGLVAVHVADCSPGAQMRQRIGGCARGGLFSRRSNAPADWWPRTPTLRILDFLRKAQKF